MSGEVQAAAVLGGLTESEELEDRRGPQRPRRRRIGLGDWLLPVYVTLAFIFLLIPIAYTFVFSFNDSLKSNIAWRGFTFDKWLNVCNVEGGAVCVRHEIRRRSERHQLERQLRELDSLGQ